MATTKFKGQPVKVIGEFIKVGAVAPDFELVKTDLSSFSLKELNGKNVILNIFPSLDTGVCATSVRTFVIIIRFPVSFVNPLDSPHPKYYNHCNRIAAGRVI